MKSGHRIALVLDPAFGKDLSRLGAVNHTRIVDSEANAEAGDAPEGGVTTFRPGESAEEDAAYLLRVIDEHHGATSGFPPLSSVEVWGVGLTPEVSDVAGELGLRTVEETATGFIARRA